MVDIIETVKNVIVSYEELCEPNKNKRRNIIISASNIPDEHIMRCDIPNEAEYDDTCAIIPIHLQYIGLNAEEKITGFITHMYQDFIILKHAEYKCVVPIEEIPKEFTYKSGAYEASFVRLQMDDELLMNIITIIEKEKMIVCSMCPRNDLDEVGPTGFKLTSK